MKPERNKIITLNYINTTVLLKGLGGKYPHIPDFGMMAQESLIDYVALWAFTPNRATFMMSNFLFLDTGEQYNHIYSVRQ